MNARIMLISLLLLATGCGGGGGSSSAPPPNPSTVASISVAPADVTLLRGETAQLSATLRNASGQTLQGRSVSWQSQDGLTVTVSATGQIQALRTGTVSVSAAADGKIATARVVVNEIPVAVTRVELEAARVRLEEGSRLRLRATAYDAAGGVISGRGEQWSADTSGIVEVAPLGMVTALRPGSGTVTVRVDGQQASATVDVFADYSHDLIYGRAPIAAPTQLFSSDLRDPSATASLVFPAGRLASNAAASPAGDRIAFVVPDGLDAAHWQSNIFVANRDGSSAMRLTTIAARNDAPHWSPDGSRIVFSSQPLGGRPDIWVINADGTNPVNLTADELQSGQYSPAWSPAMAGGERIAYTRRSNGIGQLWTMKTDGSDKRALTPESAFDDDEAAWSPDGQSLVFRRSGIAVFGDLYLVSSAGGAGHALMPHYSLPFEQLSPAWSPDGKLIAFLSRHGGETHQVWTVWADGTRLARRTFEAQGHSDPGWIRRS